MHDPMNINLIKHNKAACHPPKSGSVAPVLVKINFHDNRDIAWRRCSWLEKNRKLRRQDVIVNECLVPRDRAMKLDAIAKSIPILNQSRTYILTVHSFPSSKRKKIASVEELSSLQKKIDQTTLGVSTKFSVDTLRPLKYSKIDTPTIFWHLQSAKTNKMNLLPVQQHKKLLRSLKLFLP